MGCLYTLLKVASGLIGMVLLLGGVGSFFYGVFLILAALTDNSSTNLPQGIAFAIGGIVVSTIATIMGKFARGDYEQKRKVDMM